MTQIELQELLSSEIKSVVDSKTMSEEDRKIVLNTASVAASLAKQMINNADLVLRRDIAIGKNIINSNSESMKL